MVYICEKEEIGEVCSVKWGEWTSFRREDLGAVGEEDGVFLCCGEVGCIL